MENLNEIKNLTYQSEDGKVKLDVIFDGSTFWLNQKQMSQLFGKSQSTIAEHIANIYKEKKLDENKTKRKFGAKVGIKSNIGKTDKTELSSKSANYYSLDVVLFIGQKVTSDKTERFQKWTSERLVGSSETIDKKQNSIWQMFKSFMTKLTNEIQKDNAPTSKTERVSLTQDDIIQRKIEVLEQSKQLSKMGYSAGLLIAKYGKKIDEKLEPFRKEGSPYKHALKGNVNIQELESMNDELHRTLTEAAADFLKADFLKTYIDAVNPEDRQQWVLSEVDKARIEGANNAIKVIEEEARLSVRDMLKQVAKPENGVFLSPTMFFLACILPLGTGFTCYAIGSMETLPGKVSIMLWATSATIFLAYGLVSFFNRQKS